MSDVVLIASNLIMFSAVSILIMYIIRQNIIKQSLDEKRYSSIITGLITDVTKGQTTYKQEIIDEIKELNAATTKIFVGIEIVTNNIKELIDNATVISNNIKIASDNIEKCSTTHVPCEYTNRIGEIVEELKNITMELRKLQKQ